MAKTDKRIDAYIAKSAEFARPILQYIRSAVHKACPDVTETIKWGFPHFDYKGILCSAAAFKGHCAFIFWKGALLKDPKGYLEKESRTAMGQFGRIASLADLPKEKELIALIKEAMKLNEAGTKAQKPKSKRDPERKVDVPPYFLKALKADKTAWGHWSAFSYSYRKDYVEYLEEAKTPETREKRLVISIAQIAEGKGRNWKYEKKKGS